MWATALGTLTLHRWTHDLSRIRTRMNRLPTRFELLSSFESTQEPNRDS